MRNDPIPSTHARPTSPEGRPSTGGARTREYRPEFEALRGIAMLLVFWFHVDTQIVPAFPPGTPPVDLARAWIRAGHTGVDLFFVLSAFLLSLPFLEEVAGGPHVELARYARRRALRILPAYWLAVAIGTLATAKHLADLRRGIPHLLFLGSFTGIESVLFPYSAVWWSLCTEFQLYVALPLIAWWARPGIPRWTAVTVLVGLLGSHVLLLLGLFPAHSLGIIYLQAQNSILGRNPTFLVGIAAAEIYRRYGARLRDSMANSRFWCSGGADLVLLAVLFLLARQLRWYASAGSAARQVPWNQIWHTEVGALWAGVLLLLVLAPLRSKRCLVNPFLEWCGKISYSVYLIHVPFMLFAIGYGRALFPGQPKGWTAATWAVVVVSTLGCFALATLTYRFVELPFQRRRDRWRR